VTLAEVFRQKGYATAGFFENPFAHPGYGLNRGFEVYDYAPGDNLTIRRADMVTATASRWLLTRDRKNQPFFMTVHYFDPHLAYDPPPQFMVTYAYGYKGKLVPPYNPDRDELKKLKSGELKPSDEDRAFIEALFDAEVAFADSQIGAFLNFLRQQGLYDRTLIIVTGDHGEEFWEHGGFEHGHSLYHELLEVPLILKFPGGKWAGTSVPERVSLTDLFPTVMQYLGWPVPFAVDGRSFLSASDMDFKFAPRAGIISENLHYGPEQQSIYCGPHHLIINRVTGRLELYDLNSDPLETKNVLGQKQALPAECKDQVLAVAKKLKELESAPPREFPPDPETRAKLRALGYLK
jgi:arylsulfatase A-like enzyme